MYGVAKVAILFLASIFLVACSAEYDDNCFNFDWGNENPFYGEILTVAVVDPTFNYNAFARAYMNNNPGVTIELIHFNGDLNRGQQQIGLQLMAGYSPVLICGFLLDYQHPSTSRLLTDWLPIMYASPNFDENDWFPNIFDALSINDKLYGFPLSFLHSYIVVNSTIPGVAEVFSEYESISFTDMMELYNAFHQESDAFYITHDFDVFLAVRLNIHRFLDTEEGWVDFNNKDFIDLISNAKEITQPNRVHSDMPWTGFANRNEELRLSQSYFFRRAPYYFVEYFGIFDDDTIFVNPIPEVSNNGDLLIWSLESFVLSASATPAEQALALDFVQFMLDPDDDLLALSNRRYLGAGPINRNSMRLRAEEMFPQEISRFYTGPMVNNPWRLNVSMNEATRILYDEMTLIRDMAMANFNFLPEIIRDIIQESVNRFDAGLTTAEQMAVDLQNQITLVLMEIQ